MMQAPNDDKEKGTDANPSAEGNRASGAEGAPTPQTSERKVISNRLNAQHSTGPRSDRGKAVVRNNAWRHGMYAKGAVILQGPAKENLEDFERLLRGFEATWKPKNEVAKYYVRLLAETEWRLQRVVSAEAGEISKYTIAFCEAEDRRFAEAIADVEKKLKLLNQVRDEIQQCGYVSEASQKALTHALGEDSPLVAQCLEMSQLSEQLRAESEREPSHEGGRPEDSGAENAAGEDLERDLMMKLEVNAGVLRKSLEDLNAAYAEQREITVLTNKLPPEKSVNNVIHYQTALEKTRERLVRLLMQLKGNQG